MRSKPDSSVVLGILAVLSMTVLAGCGPGENPNETDAPQSDASACAPPMDQWARNPYVLIPEAERAATPEDAASAAAAAASLEITAVEDGPGPDLKDVEVLGDGVAGTFHVQKIKGRWIAVGGEGCGAQIPSRFGDEDCPIPSDAPTQDGESFLVDCGAAVD